MAPAPRPRCQEILNYVCKKLLTNVPFTQRGQESTLVLYSLVLTACKTMLSFPHTSQCIHNKVSPRCGVFFPPRAFFMIYCRACERLLRVARFWPFPSLSHPVLNLPRSAPLLSFMGRQGRFLYSLIRMYSSAARNRCSKIRVRAKYKSYLFTHYCPSIYKTSQKWLMRARRPLRVCKPGPAAPVSLPGLVIEQQVTSTLPRASPEETQMLPSP